MEQTLREANSFFSSSDLVESTSEHVDRLLGLNDDTISPELVRSVYLTDLNEVLLCGMGVMTAEAVDAEDFDLGEVVTPFPEGVVKLSIADRPSRFTVVLLSAAGVAAPVVVVVVVVAARLAMGEGVTPAILLLLLAFVRLPKPVPLMTMTFLFLGPPANFDKANRNPPKLASSKLSTFFVKECASHASTSSLGVRWSDSERLDIFVRRGEARGAWPDC